ncbi:hypothetical protein LCGC14_0956680 [marine sediment metagenome]|uniref:Uncharacterized protein n=1 Tax=marine sediment metagenome TaxID=412755 RepID=A0A0F9RM63_9ZZZZ
MKELAKALSKVYNDYFKTEEGVLKLLSNEKLKEFVLESEENAKMIYRALAENIFTHRYAGWIVSELKGEGDYRDYCCSGGEGGIENRKIWKLLKKSDLNVIGGNYTWNWILNKTVWKIRMKRLNRLMFLSLNIYKPEYLKEREKMQKEFDKLQKKLDKISKKRKGSE